ncbi:glycoside hydrolase family 16 protein [Mucilaginibacter corticis]|uniref:Glycoside hydrolase family 16 protein n=1 Tax=Mucilaginibacter corticis TaxID=2597670 RepID=A0A556MFR1_9SPHI|nr:glycoside hydrolase family 16 protein [Mucilaginibacter corticis]TSJ38615.1 glycoside hydrolase family 16 protein [Mucilaginibacter corticis]
MKPAVLLIALSCLSFFTMAQTAPKRKLVFDDEFNYNGLPDPAKWGYEKGFVRDAEPQYYTEKRLKNCRVENGMLVIEGIKEQYPNPKYKAGSNDREEKQEFAPYTSASINTDGKYSWQYGRIEVRAKVPGGNGSWPAIWMLGDDHHTNGWPRCGEIDIMEYLGRDSARVHATVHYADSLGKHRQQGNAPVVGKPADDFHVYAVEWNDQSMTFYYEDLKYYTFEYKNMKGADQNVFRKKFYLLLNLALGSKEDWGGLQDDAALPAKYYIDYVRVYQ